MELVEQEWKLLKLNNQSSRVKANRIKEGNFGNTHKNGKCNQTTKPQVCKYWHEKKRNLEMDWGEEYSYMLYIGSFADSAIRWENNAF